MSEQFLTTPNLKKYRGSGAASLSGNYMNFIPANAKLTGPIKITLTWVPKFPGQPPPQAIIIDEQCSVTTGATPASAANAVHSDNGFGDPEVITPGGTANGTTYDKLSTSAGRHFRTLPSQTDIDALYGNDDRMERPPLETSYEWTVNVSGEGKGFSQAYADCEYIAQTHIVNIGTQGTTNSDTSIERKLLAGQGIYPAVFPYKYNDPYKGSYTTQHIHWTFDKKNGSIEAKEPFNHWTGWDYTGSASLVKFPQDRRLANSTDSMVLEARRTYRASDGVELTSTEDRKLFNGLQFFHWSLKPPSTVTPIFVDATLTIGAGLINPPVALKFKLSQKITVIRPTAAFMSEEGTINIEGMPDIIAQTGDAQVPHMAASKLGSKPWLNGVSYTGVLGKGDNWLGTVQEPILFEKNPTSPGEAIGYWCFVQLIKPTRSITDELGVDKVWNLNNSNFQLDRLFPYMDDPLIDTYVSDTLGWKAYSNSVQHKRWDSPFLTLANQQAQNELYQKGGMHDQFQVYQMYLPPNWLGSDSEWVPLEYLEWHTDGDSTSADITNQTLNDPVTNTILTCLLNHVLAPSGVSLFVTPTTTSGHPIWQTVITPDTPNDFFKLRP